MAATLDSLGGDALAELVRREVKAQLDAERKARSAKAANRVTMVVFSGDLDKVMASLIIANGAAAMGMKVSMFFTFWGLSVLRRGKRIAGKDALSRAFTAMTPSGLKKLGVSKMNFAGMGAKMLRTMMKQKNVSTPEELFSMAKEAGVRMVACTTSMDVMGLDAKDLVEGLELGGVATYLGDAADSRVTLFI